MLFHNWVTKLINNTRMTCVSQLARACALQLASHLSLPLFLMWPGHLLLT